MTVRIEIELDGEKENATCQNYVWTATRPATATMLRSVSIDPAGPPTFAPDPDALAARTAIEYLKQHGIAARVLYADPPPGWVDGRLY